MAHDWNNDMAYLAARDSARARRRRQGQGLRLSWQAHLAIWVTGGLFGGLVAYLTH